MLWMRAHVLPLFCALDCDDGGTRCLPCYSDNLGQQGIPMTEMPPQAVMLDMLEKANVQELGEA